MRRLLLGLPLAFCCFSDAHAGFLGSDAQAYVAGGNAGANFFREYFRSLEHAEASGEGDSSGNNGIQHVEATASVAALLHGIGLYAFSTNTTGGGFAPRAGALASGTFTDIIYWSSNDPPPSSLRLHFDVHGTFTTTIDQAFIPWTGVSTGMTPFFSNAEEADFLVRDDVYYPYGGNLGQNAAAAGTVSLPFHDIYFFDVSYDTGYHGFGFTFGIGVLTSAWAPGSARADFAASLVAVTYTDGTPLDFPIVFDSGGRLAPIVPEPSTLALSSIGAIAIAFGRARRRRAPA